MKRAKRVAVAASAVGALALVAAGCGGSSKKASKTGSTPNTAGKQGGTLTYLAASDVDHIDPGQVYYTFGYMVHYSVNRTLYSFPAGKGAASVPDIAAGPPDISADNKTITIKIKTGIKYAPPVNREVKAADIKYAFERAFSANIASGYAGAYFQDIEGAPKAGAGPVKPISGVQAPDDTTVVIKLTKPVAQFVAQALVMPITTPVPEEYAKPFDAKTPTDFDQYASFTGPYMVKNDAKGKLVGHVPGKSITLIRNPNWVKATDYRPAYLNQIDIQEGNDDSLTATRRALTGSHIMCCDYGQPPAEILKQASTANKDQLDFIPGGGTRYIALNTTIKPFDNVNVRKAIIAASDRNALRLARGGETVGPIANGWIPPGIPGFDEGGGLTQNTDLDFLKSPTGDPAVAKKYMDAAAAEGLPIKNGKWTGSDKILTVATNADPGKKVAETFQGQIEALGFKLNFRQVPQSELYVKFCGVPAQKVALCPNVAWFKDFVDPQSMLQPTFNGNNINASNNNNWPQLNDKAINDAMDSAGVLPVGTDRNKAWADINHKIAEQAPAIPYVWDQTIMVHSKDVQSAINEYADGQDLNSTSLK